MVVLWALVFLTMMLRVGKDRQKRDKREKRKTQGQTTSEKVKAKKKNLHDACSTALRIVQLYLKNTNWLKHRVLEQKPKL